MLVYLTVHHIKKTFAPAVQIARHYTQHTKNHPFNLYHIYSYARVRCFRFHIVCANIMRSRSNRTLVWLFILKQVASTNPRHLTIPQIRPTHTSMS